jgi:hypothetical protein
LWQRWGMPETHDGPPPPPMDSGRHRLDHEPVRASAE